MSRTYRSGTAASGMFGANWRSSWDFPKLQPSGCRVLNEWDQRLISAAQTKRAQRRNHAPSLKADDSGLVPVERPPEPCYPEEVILTLPDGAQYRYLVDAGESYAPQNLSTNSRIGQVFIEGFSAADEWIVQVGQDGYVYQARSKKLIAIRRAGYDRYTLTYNGEGRLAEVQSVTGATLTFVWNGTRVAQIVDPAGRTWTYGYDANNNLAQVTPPPGTVGAKTYHYESPYGTTLLTGISLDGVRATRYSYDSTRKVDNSRAENWESSESFEYSSDYTRVTDALGQPVTYRFETAGTFRRLIQTDREATNTCSASAKTQGYDSR